MTQNYVRFRQEMINSQSGNKIWAITLIGCVDRQLYTTYVDPRNRNYANWSHVVHRPQHGFVLGAVKTRDVKRCILDADSKIIILWESDCLEQVFDEMYSVWQEQDNQTKNNFREIFE